MKWLRSMSNFQLTVNDISGIITDAGADEEEQGVAGQPFDADGSYERRP